MGTTQSITGKITRKAGNGKGIQVSGDDGWFNATDAGKGYLEKYVVGDDVIVEYVKKGVNRIIVKVTKVTETKKQESKTETVESTGFVCEECGKALKDGKYKKCYACNQKAPKEEPKPETKKDTWVSKSNYGSAEDVAGKEVGCAANSAASAVAGISNNPEEILEAWKVLFNGILEHIRLSK